MRRLTLPAALIAAHVAATTAPAQDLPSPGDPAAGRTFALEVCTPCHVVEPGQVSPRHLAIGPDFRAIANTRAMTPSALHAFLSTPHPTMPNLILSRTEQQDVIAYILSLRR